jgi:glycosyltransferase involved in cell wall biosynthesis
MRLAWFTPWPPQPSGVAGRSAELVPALAQHGHGIDVCVDEREVPVRSSNDGGPPRPGIVRIQSAHDFVWRAGRGQYDLVVYQIGNSRVHEFIWPYLVRWPGLAVLHDARLHHARGRALLASRSAATYRAEFAWSHPDVPGSAAELAAAGFDGTYYYLWPMVRAVVSTSRLVGVHSRGAAAELQAVFPERPIQYVPLSSGRPVPATPDERTRTRAELGLSGDSVVFGVFGALTPEKRVPQVLRAFRRTLARVPNTRLLLVGRSDPSLGWPELAESLGIGHTVHWLADLDDDRFERTIAAVDAVVNLRWPTALETSGTWLQALAAGRPTIVTDLVHQVDVPSLDPRTWSASGGDHSANPVTIGIDLLDEDHSLALAMRRLAVDGTLRDQLGRSARAYWEAEHSMDRMISGYESLLGRAVLLPVPAEDPPPVARPPVEETRAFVSMFGDASCRFF